MSGYATQAWVTSQLSGYATQSWVNTQIANAAVNSTVYNYVEGRITDAINSAVSQSQSWVTNSWWPYEWGQVVAWIQGQGYTANAVSSTRLTDAGTFTYLQQYTASAGWQTTGSINWHTLGIM